MERQLIHRAVVHDKLRNIVFIIKCDSSALCDIDSVNRKLKRTAFIKKKNICCNITILINSMHPCRLKRLFSLKNNPNITDPKLLINSVPSDADPSGTQVLIPGINTLDWLLTTSVVQNNLNSWSWSLTEHLYRSYTFQTNASDPDSAQDETEKKAA